MNVPFKEGDNPIVDLEKNFPQLKYDLNRVNVQKLSFQNFFARRAIGERLVLTEWWHWSYGDRYCWAYQTHSPFALFASQRPKFEIRQAVLDDAEAIASIHATRLGGRSADVSIWSCSFK
jgi:hypothetical protein